MHSALQWFGLLKDLTEFHTTLRINSHISDVHLDVGHERPAHSTQTEQVTTESSHPEGSVDDGEEAGSRIESDGLHHRATMEEVMDEDDQDNDEFWEDDDQPLGGVGDGSQSLTRPSDYLRRCCPLCFGGDEWGADTIL